MWTKCIAALVLLTAVAILSSGCQTTDRNLKQLKDEISVTVLDGGQFNKTIR